MIVNFFVSKKIKSQLQVDQQTVFDAFSNEIQSLIDNGIENADWKVNPFRSVYEYLFFRNKYFLELSVDAPDSFNNLNGLFSNGTLYRDLKRAFPQLRTHGVRLSRNFSAGYNINAFDNNACTTRISLMMLS